MQAELTIFSPLLAPMKHVIAENLVTIGRAADCTIPVKDRYLSRKHAAIVPDAGGWIVRDCGSANGTYLNGLRLDAESPLRAGDRIRIGDTEIVFQLDQTTDRLLNVAPSRTRASISLPFEQIVAAAGEPEPSTKGLERARILNALAIELIADRPLEQLFGFVLERIIEHLHPSRVAIALLGSDGESFARVEVRRSDSDDVSELAISHTLLAELVQEKRALAFTDTSIDDKLSRAQSIVTQGIHSVLCAPLMIGDSVVGILYVDFLYTQRSISEEDVVLVAQIARLAAVKLENTRLRESAIEKRLVDEELKMAYMVQRRLLPDRPPAVDGYTFAALNRPCRTVSGDYYDFVVRPDGRIYFVVADVSGKGVTAALLMAGLQASFRIFTKSDPSPEVLVSQINGALRETMPQAKFVTLFAGRLDPRSGEVEFTNAGHTPPLHIRADGVVELAETDLLIGMFSEVDYAKQTMKLERGDALLLFTDGVSEAENLHGIELGSTALARALAPLHGSSADWLADSVERAVMSHAGSAELADDLTLVVVSRIA
jgi:phosphoserine phosphatase RsbU/P